MSSVTGKRSHGLHKLFLCFKLALVESYPKKNDLFNPQSFMSPLRKFFLLKNERRADCVKLHSLAMLQPTPIGAELELRASTLHSVLSSV